MLKRIVVASVLILSGLMAGLYFILSPINPGGTNLISVTGTLEPGVEAGCVILRTDGGTQYLLTGWSNFPSNGARVTVIGFIDNSAASYCMQGQVAVHVVSISTLASSTVTVSVSESIGYSIGSTTASSGTLIVGSTQQSTTMSSLWVTVGGNVYSVVENPACYPQCLAPSFILTYLYIPPGSGCTGSMACYPPPKYRLLNTTGNSFWTTAPNGTYAVVSGMLVIPSSWDCNSIYIPKICMTGDIYVQNVTYS